MYDTGITISQIRRQIKAIKRKYAREIAAAVLSPNPPMDRDGRGEDTGRGRGSNRRGWSGLEFG